MAFDAGTVQPHGKRTAIALSPRALPRVHRGYAVVILVVVVAMLATAWLITSFGATAVRIERERKTTAALALARQALMFWKTCPKPFYVVAVMRR